MSARVRGLESDLRHSSEALSPTGAHRPGRTPGPGPDPGLHAGGRAAVRRSGRAAFANAALEQHLGDGPDGPLSCIPLALREAVARSRDRPKRVPSRSKWFDRRAGCAPGTTPADDEGSVLLVVSDITETRRIESVRRDFVANASHELKTPAASIQAAAETLRSAARARIRPPFTGSPRSWSVKRSASRASWRICSTSRGWNREASSANASGSTPSSARSASATRSKPGIRLALGILAPTASAASRLRPGPLAAGAQPDRQRHPLHAARRPRRRDRDPESGDGDVLLTVRRHWPGHPDRGTSPAYSNGSTGSIERAPGRPAARAWAWRS